MAASLDQDQERQLDLLKIACCVAWADGEVSPEEKRLIEKLVERYFPDAEGEDGIVDATRQLVAWSQDFSVLDQVIPRLTTQEDRRLAVKFAYMVARVSQGPGDDSAINPQEKKAYRHLVHGLGLSDEEVEETEWAASKELDASKGIQGLFEFLFDGLAAWPSQGVQQSSPMLWL
jgi:tellurite resistance protein